MKIIDLQLIHFGDGLFSQTEQKRIRARQSGDPRLRRTRGTSIERGFRINAAISFFDGLRALPSGRALDLIQETHILLPTLEH